jgi:hypothetical protein
VGATRRKKPNGIGHRDPIYMVAVMELVSRGAGGRRGPAYVGATRRKKPSGIGDRDPRYVVAFERHESMRRGRGFLKPALR